MRYVNHHAYLIHFLHHLAAECSQALAGICCIGRRITDIIVIRMGEGHVLNTHILILLHVLDVLTDAIAVFDTQEECLLSFGLQSAGIFFSQSNATIILVFFYILKDRLQQGSAVLYSLLRRSLITFLLCQECSQELGIELSFFHLLDAHLITLAPTHTERTSGKPKRSVGMSIYRKDACMDILRLLEGFCLAHQELEELAHQCITIGCKDFRMELGADNLTVRISFNHFRHTVVGPTYNLQSTSQLFDGLMMESIDLYFLFTQNLMHHASFYHRYAMGRHCTCLALTMVNV